MRIGYNAMLLTGNYTGVQQYIVRLARALQSVDESNDYVGYLPADAPAPWDEHERWETYRTSFKGDRRLMRVLWEELWLPRLAFKQDLDLVHCPGYVAPNLVRHPTVITVHDVIALSHPECCRPRNVKHFKRRLPRSIERAQRIIVPSEATRKQVELRLDTGADKVRVVPLGVDARFKPIDAQDELKRLRQEVGLPRRFLLFVGNREPKKNLLNLVKAFFAAVQSESYREHQEKRVRKRGSAEEFHLVLVGDQGWGNVDADLKRLINDLGFAERVLTTDYVADEALPYIYNMAEAVVMPSLVEGFGLPALEAMACGVPVLISQDAALQEVAGDAAHSVDALDLRALREGIEQVLFDRPLRRRLRERASQRARQFTWERTASETMAVYEEALAAWEKVGSGE